MMWAKVRRPQQARLQDHPAPAVTRSNLNKRKQSETYLWRCTSYQKMLQGKNWKRSTEERKKSTEGALCQFWVTPIDVYYIPFYLVIFFMFIHSRNTVEHVHFIDMFMSHPGADPNRLKGHTPLNSSTSRSFPRPPQWPDRRGYYN